MNNTRLTIPATMLELLEHVDVGDDVNYDAGSQTSKYI